MYSSEQYSVRQFSISLCSVRHNPERPATVVAFPCFTVVKSFTRWYVLLMLFYLRFSSISLQCTPIQSSFAFFMHLLMLLVNSWYFSDPSGSNLFFPSSLPLSRRSRISVHDGERCKLPAYHSLEGFQHIRIFQLFEVRLESCVFWPDDSFQAKVEGHHQQVVVTSDVCCGKTSCSGTVRP